MPPSAQPAARLTDVVISIVRLMTIPKENFFGVSVSDQLINARRRRIATRNELRRRRSASTPRNMQDGSDTMSTMSKNALPYRCRDT